MGLGIGLGSWFEYFRQYNVIRRIGIRRNGAEPALYPLTRPAHAVESVFVSSGVGFSDDNTVCDIALLNKSSGCHLLYDITQCYLPGYHPTQVNTRR